MGSDLGTGASGALIHTKTTKTIKSTKRSARIPPSSATNQCREGRKYKTAPIPFREQVGDGEDPDGDHEAREEIVPPGPHVLRERALARRAESET